MLIVLPVCSKDVSSALRNLEWAISLDKTVPFPALIAHDRDFDPSPLLPLCKEYFSSVSTFAYDTWKGDENWPYPQNWAWQNTARHIASLPNPEPWFWWEQDAIPLKAGWLDTLYKIYTASGKLFAGPVAQQAGLTYMAGVAIYPHDTSRCTSALLCRAQPWDVVASTRDGIMPRTHDLSDVIIHNPTIANVHFTSLDDVRQRIPASGVIFHKCKDSSLLDVLQGKQVRRQSIMSPLRDVPSFCDQTDWPSGYFAFPAANNTVYFNCSVAQANGALHLFTRRWRYNLGQGQSNTRINRSDLAIWRIRQNMTLDSNPIIPHTPNRYPHEQWEDPRAIVGKDGNVYLSFATWVHYKQWSIRQSFARLSQDWRKVVPIWEVPYGGNTRNPTTGKTHEKNWIWFEHEGKWHCQYSINPGEVFSVTNGVVDNVWKAPDIKVPWDFGMPLRGGTPPTRVGDEYIAFFHTAVTWQKPKRRYHIGAYAFSAKPPFTLKRITRMPLLSGSEHDFRTLAGPLVIFPNGAILQDGQWLVTFGVNDEACGWIKIPHEDLDERLEPVKPTIMASIIHTLL